MAFRAMRVYTASDLNVIPSECTIHTVALVRTNALQWSCREGDTLRVQTPYLSYSASSLSLVHHVVIGGVKSRRRSGFGVSIERRSRS